ncbi:MAG: hypothetical protein LBT70_03785 [Holosporaceae bacterium]|nr:hypothetical protein [Holosporaceae bacterium]
MKIEKTNLLHNKVFFAGINGNASTSILSDIISSKSSQTLDFKRILKMALGAIFISFMGINGANATEQKPILSFDNYSPLENLGIYIRDIGNKFPNSCYYSGSRMFSMPVRKGYLNITYSNGHVYQGDCWDGIPDGKGTLYVVDKCNIRILYKGQWKNGLFSGNGSLNFGDQGSYEGPFEKGLPHGCGLKIYPGGQISYKGDFVRGLREGIGQLLRTINHDFYTMKFVPNHGKWGERRILTRRKSLIKILRQGFWKNDQLVTTRKSQEHPPLAPSTLRTMFRLPEAEESAETEELTNEPQEPKAEELTNKPQDPKTEELTNKPQDPKAEDETLIYSDYFFVDPQNSDL